MSISNFELLRHIKQEVDFVLRVTFQKSQQVVLNDEILCRAIIRSLEIIGEATKKLDPDFKLAHPHVEWKKIARTRDKLIHEYFGVDYDIVWDIVTNKLPELQFQVDALLAE